MMLREFDPLNPTPEYVPMPDYHATVTIQLCELLEYKFIDWERDDCDWSEHAYDADQYKRVCKMFNERFMWREIGYANPGEFKQQLLYKLRYELMPKYKPLYAAEAKGIDYLADAVEYGKDRAINSEFPETMLSGNSDYASSGVDKEYEHVKQGNMLDNIERYKESMRTVDMMLLDELECMFSCLVSVAVNAY